jgi:hypothetical protein
MVLKRLVGNSAHRQPTAGLKTVMATTRVGFVIRGNIKYINNIYVYFNGFAYLRET